MRLTLALRPTPALYWNIKLFFPDLVTFSPKPTTEPVPVSQKNESDDRDLTSLTNRSVSFCFTRPPRTWSSNHPAITGHKTGAKYSKLSSTGKPPFSEHNQNTANSIKLQQRKNFSLTSRGSLVQSQSCPPFFLPKN